MDTVSNCPVRLLCVNDVQIGPRGLKWTRKQPLSLYHQEQLKLFKVHVRRDSCFLPPPYECYSTNQHQCHYPYYKLTCFQCSNTIDICSYIYIYICILAKIDCLFTRMPYHQPVVLPCQFCEPVPTVTSIFLILGDSSLLGTSSNGMFMKSLDWSFNSLAEQIFLAMSACQMH